MDVDNDGCIYLDHPATTPCDPRVVEAMLPWLGARAANAAQALHARGRAAAGALELAAAHVAATAGVDPRDAHVVWTSGATEANNLAVLGAGAARGAGAPVVVGATEHASVLGPARVLAVRGRAVHVAGVDGSGRVDLLELERLLGERPALVSVQAANNETGVLQALDVIGPLVREAGALLHVDAVQAFGKVELDPVRDCIDLLSVSGHKVCGPTGVGALVAIGEAARASLVPLMYGGGQQGGVRPGTANVAGCVGLGEAARIARASMRDEARRCGALRDRLERELAGRVPGIVVRGAAAPRTPYIASIGFGRLRATDVLAGAPQVAASTTSACSSGGTSHVLRAMGLDPVQAGATIRLGVGRSTTGVDVDRAVDALVAAANGTTRGVRGIVRRTVAPALSPA